MYATRSGLIPVGLPRTQGSETLGWKPQSRWD